jgi:pyruvate carboxylase subunit B
MRYTVEVGGKAVVVDINGEQVLVDGVPAEVALGGVPGSAIRRLLEGQESQELVAVPGEERGQFRLLAEGQRLEAVVLDDRALAVRAGARLAGGGGGAGILKAPMPGLVVRVLVAEGDEVPAGKGMVVVEAMKMENELKSAGAGMVKKVHVAPGDRVEKGAPLVELG